MPGHARNILRNTLAAAAAGLALAAGVSGCLAPGPALYMEGEPAILKRQFAGTGVEVLMQGDGLLIRLPGDVLFDVDRAELAEDFFPHLNNLVLAAGRHPEAQVEVVGHADSTGSEPHNQDLSQRRASAVAAYLVGAGVAGERLLVLGRGEHAPLADNDTPEGRARNRRVEVVLRPPRPKPAVEGQPIAGAGSWPMEPIT